MGNRVRQHDTDIDRLWRLQRQQSDGWPIGGLFPTIPTLPDSSGSGSGSPVKSSASPSSSSSSNSSSNNSSSSNSSGSSGSSSAAAGTCPAAMVTITVAITSGGGSFDGGDTTATCYPLGGTGPGWEATLSGTSDLVSVTCDAGLMVVNYIHYTIFGVTSSQAAFASTNGWTGSLTGAAGTIPVSVSW